MLVLFFNENKVKDRIKGIYFIAFGILYGLLNQGSLKSQDPNILIVQCILDDLIKLHTIIQTSYFSPCLKWQRFMDLVGLLFCCGAHLQEYL